MNAFEVVVIGAGNAGLSAAIQASQAGAKVLVLEKAPRHLRGGNSSLTMNMRFVHRKIDDLLGLLEPGVDEPSLDMLRTVYEPYPPDRLRDDLIRASRGKVSPSPLQAFLDGSETLAPWLRSLGHVWEVKPIRYQQRSSLPIRLRGGGAALQERNFSVAEAMGVTVQYESELSGFEGSEGRIERLRCAVAGVPEVIEAKQFVIASGGFQSDAELRGKFLGEDWREVHLRGVPFNTGIGLLAAIQQGAATDGDMSSCHATPQSSRLEAFQMPGSSDASQANSRYCFHMGVTVNRDGRRFLDERLDHPNFLYAAFGAAIAQQPGAVAYQLFDARAFSSLTRGYFRQGELRRASDLKTLATSFGLNAENLAEEVAASGSIISTPPFYMCEVRAGLTFTFGGLETNAAAAVMREGNRPFHNLWAAGEVVGGLFHGHYPGGAGLAAGAALGRLAGKNAAEAALAQRC